MIIGLFAVVMIFGGMASLGVDTSLGVAKTNAPVKAAKITAPDFKYFDISSTPND